MRSQHLFQSPGSWLFVNTLARGGLSPSLLCDSLLSSHAKKMHSHLFPVRKILCLQETFQCPSAASEHSHVLCQKRGVSDQARCTLRDYDLVVMLRKSVTEVLPENQEFWGSIPGTNGLFWWRETIRAQKTRSQAFRSGVTSGSSFP